MDRLNGKLNVLKKMCVAAAVLCLPLWAFSYTTGKLIFWDEYPVVPTACDLQRFLANYCMFGVPLLIALLVMGCRVRHKKISAVLCAAGLVLFVGTAVLSVSGVVSLHNLHFKPFEQLAGMGVYKIRIDLWQGRDEDGSDIWLNVEDSDCWSVAIYLTQLDCYYEPLHLSAADKLAALDLLHPAWHFRVSNVETDGDVWRLAICGENYCILSRNGEPPKAYEVRPIYYENWSGYVNGDLLYDYEHLSEKYSE